MMLLKYNLAYFYHKYWHIYSVIVSAAYNERIAAASVETGAFSHGSRRTTTSRSTTTSGGSTAQESKRVRKIFHRSTLGMSIDLPRRPLRVATRSSTATVCPAIQQLRIRREIGSIICLFRVPSPYPTPVKPMARDSPHHSGRD